MIRGIEIPSCGPNGCTCGDHCEVGIQLYNGTMLFISKLPPDDVIHLVGKSREHVVGFMYDEARRLFLLSACKQQLHKPTDIIWAACTSNFIDYARWSFEYAGYTIVTRHPVEADDDGYRIIMLDNATTCQYSRVEFSKAAEA